MNLILENSMLTFGIGWGLGIAAGLNLARLIWPEEGTYIGDLIRAAIARKYEESEKES